MGRGTMGKTDHLLESTTMRELDETFLQECLSQLRDGETVTVRVGVRFRRKVREALADLGAARDELDRLVVE